MIKIDKSFLLSAEDFAKAELQCEVGECSDENRENSFEGNLTHALQHVLPRLNATHAFVNYGWNQSIAMFSQLSCKLEAFARQHPEIKVFLTSHPYHKSSTSTKTRFDPRNLKCKCNVLDRSGMSTDVPDSWYWDTQHVLSILNEEFNHQFIQQVCPLGELSF